MHLELAQQVSAQARYSIYSVFLLLNRGSAATGSRPGLLAPLLWPRFGCARGALTVSALTINRRELVRGRIFMECCVLLLQARFRQC